MRAEKVRTTDGTQLGYEAQACPWGHSIARQATLNVNHVEGLVSTAVMIPLLHADDVGVQATCVVESATVRASWISKTAAGIPGDASLPARQLGRDALVRRMMASRLSKPARWNVFLPMSMPIVDRLIRRFLTGMHRRLLEL